MKHGGEEYVLKMKHKETWGEEYVFKMKHKETWVTMDTDFINN
jgi:hypothetical protein